MPAGDLDTGTISSGPFTLPYVADGHGHPAIVIGSSRYYPRVFSRNLRSHLRLVFMDTRGFAPSPGVVDTSEFELEKLVDDVERVREHLGLDRVMVIGHSGHAYMALEYAKKYPERTTHCVMIGIAPSLSPANAEAASQNYLALADDDRLAAERANMAACPDDVLAALPSDEAMVRGYVRNAARVWYNPRFDSTPLWDGVAINMDMFGLVWGKLFPAIDVTAGLDQFDRPVFLALGRYDFLVAPPSSWEPIRPLFRNLTIRVFEKSGHTPPFEEPETFDRELVKWMSRT